MVSLTRYNEYIRFASFLLWLAVAASSVYFFVVPLAKAGDPRAVVWVVAFSVYGVCLAAASRPRPDASRARTTVVVAIVVQSVAVLVMARIAPCLLIGYSYVIVAWHAGLIFPIRVTAPWFVVQMLALGYIYHVTWPGLTGFTAAVAHVASMTFSLLAATIARSEALARSELAEVNAELRATRQLLAETTRAAECARISRDLHDVLGHNLAALSLHLEVATHLANGKALEHVEQSRSLTRLLLGEVREVVNATRSVEGIDIRAALATIVSGLPGLRVHLDFPEDVTVDDPLRAQALLRCVQELATNAVKHAGAENLWITLRRTERGIRITAVDDGCGAETLSFGNGLSGMRDRFEHLGGHIRVETARAAGFTVEALLPMENQVA
jgi:signal transduction histidine kinase